MIRSFTRTRKLEDAPEFPQARFRVDSNRQAAMLVAALTVVIVVAAVMLSLLLSVQHRAVAAQRTIWNAQADYAALAVATAPNRPETLSLPTPVVVAVEADRVTLRTSGGKPLAAAHIRTAISNNSTDSSEDDQ